MHYYFAYYIADATIVGVVENFGKKIESRDRIGIYTYMEIGGGGIDGIHRVFPF